MKNNSKRICALLLAIVMCIGCVVPVFAETDVHAHAEEGKCPGKGEYHTEENSTWDEPTEKDVYDPGCGKLGYTKFTCNVCGDNFLDRWVDALTGCDYDIDVTNPVCAKDGTLTDGYLTVVCKVHTGATETKVTVADAEDVWTAYGYNRADFIAAHKYDKQSSDNSCLEGGKTWEECSVCGHVINEKPVAATGHAYKNVGFVDADGNDTTPTCLKDGLAKYVCDNCDDVKYVVVKATSDNAKHSYNEKDIVVITPADCDTPGKGEVKCTACGKMVEITIEATGHTKETIKGTPATCTADGLTDGVKCSVCNTILVEQKPDPMIKHDMKEVDGSRETLIDASFKYNKDGKYACGKYDVWTEKCAVCGHEEPKSTTPAAHNKGADPEIIESTCYSFGFKVYACTECGDPSISEPIEKKDHTWSAWEEITPAGCETEGLKSRYCTVCKAAGVEEDKIGYEEEPIPAGQHSWVKDEDKSFNSTCTVKGLLVEFCSKNCGVKNKETVLDLDLKGHDWDLADAYEATAEIGDQHYIFLAKAPTCEDYGKEALVCPYCDEVKNRAVDFIGHDYTIYDNSVNADKNPTCQAEGGYYMLCANECGKGEYVAAHDLPDNHDKYDAEIHQIIPCNTNGEYNETSATCLVAGLKTWKCSMCLEVSKTEPIPALKHKWSEEIYTQLPQCDGTAGFTYKVCANGKACDVYNTVIADKAILKVEDIEPEFDTNKYHHTNAQIKANTIYYNGVKFETAADALAQATADGRLDLLGLVRVGSCEFAPVYDMECVGCKLALKEGETLDETLPDDEKPRYGFYHHEVGAFEHTYSALTEAVAPICTADGKIAYYTCTVCLHYFAAVETDDTTDADGFVPGADLGKNPDLTDKSSGHDLTNPVAAKAPKCTENGVKAHYDCKACGKLLDTDGKTVISKADTVDPMTGHTFVAHKANAPTCTEAGNFAYYTCSDCGKFFSGSINVETDKYTTTYITEKDTVDAALNHDYKPVEKVDATCTDPGYVRYSCARCGNIELGVIDAKVDYIDGYKLATGHTAGAEYKIAPNCKKGTVGYEKAVDCTVCGAELVREGEIAVAHYNAKGDKLEVNCDATITDRVCVAGCGETIPVHDFVITHYEANCVQREYVLRVCQNAKCGHWETEDIAATVPDKHASVVTKPDPDATCTATGVSKTYCEACKTVISTEEIPVADHSYTVFVESVDAKLGQKGYTINKCATCDKTETTYTDALEGITFTYELYNALDKNAAFVNSGKVAFKVKVQAYKATLCDIYLAFAYNTDVLTYASAEMFYNDIFVTENCEFGNLNGIASIHARVSSTENVDATLNTLDADGNCVAQDFAIIYFTINNNVAAGKYQNLISLATATNGNLFESSVGNAAEENIASSKANGDEFDTFTAVESDCEIKALCDANGDSVLNGQDAVALLNMVKSDAYSASADINKDGSVDAKDYVLLQQLINLVKDYDEVCKAQA